jgi:hypothetical protein
MQTFDPDAIAQPAVAWKQPAEALDHAVDFSLRLKTAASIASCGITAKNKETLADATAEIIATNPAPQVLTGTKIVQFRAQAGTDGDVYLITVQAVANDGQVAEFDIELNIKEF